ncbi:MAG: hypothetical protein CVV00_07455 [Firmicutes bacterium HGW-Firmicutes-5]|nr:MAG: hypothetical protein CVV00_07455 [Firmicutes bacterium HGW-Firmicutes-5]
MLTFAICEDDLLQQEEMINLIRKMGFDESLDIKTYRSGEDLIHAYEEELRFSVLLLDMKMNELDGIQTANVIRKSDKNGIIIIVTSIIEYAIEGYSIDAYDFILKPIDEEKFYKVVGKAVREVHRRTNKVYKIQTREKTKVIRLSDITYFESNKKKVLVHTKEETYENIESISAVENCLNKDGFVRISRYYLVNVNHIMEIGNTHLTLSSKEELKYSSKYKEILKSEYMKLMMGVMEY